MIKNCIIYGYSGEDVALLLLKLLSNNSRYSIKYNTDNSQIIITRQDNVKETN